MSIGRSALLVVVALGVLLFGGCASLQWCEPIEVSMVDLEPLQGEGMELRMLVKLRIQNPNDIPLDFNGVSVAMDVQGRRFATGVSDAGGSVPRFGETIVGVPVSVSAFRIAGQVIGLATSDHGEKLTYRMTGKLAGPAFNSVHFESAGQFNFPAEIFLSAR